MKKKIVSLLTAAVLVMSMGTVAYAAGSPTADKVTEVKENTTQKVEVATPETKAPTTYVEETKVAETTVKNSNGESVSVKPIVAAVSETTVATTAKEVEAQLKDVEKLATTIDAPELKTAATDSTKKIVPEIKTVVNISVPDDVVISKENPISLTIAVEGIKAGDNILVLHYNGTAWETIKPEKVNDGSIVAKFTSLSPIAIAKLSVVDADTAVTPVTPSTTTTPATTTTTTTTSATTTSTAKTSPKTGMETSAMPLMVLAFAAAGLVCTKKAKSF